MSDYNNKGYEEYNDLHDTSGDYTKRTLDENADPYFSNKSTSKKGIDLKLALKLTTTAASVTLVGGAVAADVIDVVPSSGEEVLPVGTELTVFLDLGDIGLYNGEKGSAISKYSITNGISLDTKVGDTLPDGKVITSSTKQSFKGWLHYESDGVTVTECDKVLGYRDYVYVATFNDDPKYDVTVTSVPAWLKQEQYDYLAYAWKDNGKTTDYYWFPFELDNSGTATAEFTIEPDGFDLCVVHKGTTEGNWKNKTKEEVGRIYFQTKDITYKKGTKEYISPEWLYFPNNYPEVSNVKLHRFTNIPAYIYNGDYTYFTFSWGGKGASWNEATFFTRDIFICNIPTDATGVNLLACHKGTTAPQWDKAGTFDYDYIAWHGPGRIYYQTKNIMLGTSTSHFSVEWIEVPNDYNEFLK